MTTMELAHAVSVDEKNRRVEKILRELGTLSRELLSDPAVIEILLNEQGDLWAERLGEGMVQVGTIQTSRAEALIYSVAAFHNTTITRENPILECELPHYNARFEAVIPPVVSGPVFSIRMPAIQVFTLAHYVAAGIMTEGQKVQVQETILARKNILVVGGTGTGKTTLTNALIAEVVRVNPEHRLVIIEDTSEIQCQAINAVKLHSTENIDMLRLLKTTMRLRPDRIIVGEVRGPEALALLKAWNTGHPGGVATVHANNAQAGLIRLEQLIAEASVNPMQTLIGEAIDIIISIVKTPSGRKVDEILTVTGFSNGSYLVE